MLSINELSAGWLNFTVTYGGKSVECDVSDVGHDAVAGMMRGFVDAVMGGEGQTAWC